MNIDTNNVLFSKNDIMTLYHVTSIENYDSIMEFGLDPDKRKVTPMPKELYDQYNKDMIKKLGRPVPELPYHYTHIPPCIYLSSIKDEAFKHYDHVIKKLRIKNPIILEIKIPKNYYEKIKCDSPKLLGAKSWQEYRNLLLVYEPEYVIDAIVNGASPSDIDRKVQKMWNREQGQLTVRGVIPPSMITRIK